MPIHLIKRINRKNWLTLHDHQIHRSSHEQLPDYHYDALIKGIVCPTCSSYLAVIDHKHLFCKKCSYKEKVDYAVKRSIIEFTTLFPTQKITTNIIHEWCHIIKSKKTIRRILKKYMTSNSKGRHTYYTFKN